MQSPGTPGTTLVNNGVASWTSGGIVMQNNSTIDNYGTFNFSPSQSGDLFNGTFDLAPDEGTFNNAGTFNAAPGATIQDGFGVAFNDTGTVNLTSGFLWLLGGGLIRYGGLPGQPIDDPAIRRHLELRPADDPERRLDRVPGLGRTEAAAPRRFKAATPP